MDKDLEFLKDVDDRYLDVLVDVMINYDGGKEKLKAIKEEYNKFGTSYKNYLDDIVDVYINYGNDAYASVTKGIKNSYRHILNDVCSGFKIKYDVNKSLEHNEQCVLCIDIILTVTVGVRYDVNLSTCTVTVFSRSDCHVIATCRCTVVH